ncbi:hypothetical protein GCK72_000689 [Caenorhabditis remanei]|uniref:RING-type domain-containing protein n=1 Tax=Caenorhabditis remanei TaxID=31234 RepID=A0A6A5HQC9_CAERE|nr:hypothetical protein GCK72_000689 [Caenorhabditis remanei]KAF1768876.1 hypothetical protein GCK72_000689 [Caenorhabditis remanei]
MASAEQRRRQMLMEQERKDRELAERLAQEEWQTPPRPTRRNNRGTADEASPASSTRGRGRGRGRGRPSRTNQRARTSPSPSTDSDGSSVRIVPTPPGRQLRIMTPPRRMQARRGPSPPRQARMDSRGQYAPPHRRQLATVAARERGSVRGRGRGRPSRTNRRARTSPSPSTDSDGSSVRIVPTPPERQLRVTTPPRRMQARRGSSPPRRARMDARGQYAPPYRRPVAAIRIARRGSSTANPRPRVARMDPFHRAPLASSDDDSEEDNDNEHVSSPAISASYIRSLLNPLLRRNALHEFARTAMDFSDTDSNDGDYDDDDDDVSMGSVEDDDDDDIRILDDIGPVRAEENNIRQPIFEEDRDMYSRELDLYHDEDEYQVPPPRVVQGRGKAAEPDPTWGDCTMCSSTPTKPQGCKKCLQFLGCADCVRRWHGARQSSFDRPNCPLCRAPWNGDTPGVLLMPTIEKHRLKNAAKASSSSSSGPSTSAGPSSSS